MCVVLDKILDRPPPCGCHEFICEHSVSSFVPPSAAESEASLRRLMQAEMHRLSCVTCRRERMAALAALGRRHWMKYRAATRIFDESRRRPYASFRRRG